MNDTGVQYERGRITETHSRHTDTAAAAAASAAVGAELKRGR